MWNIFSICIFIPCVPIGFGCRYRSIHTNVGFLCEKCSISNSITFITSIAFIYVWMDLISSFFFLHDIHDNANRSIFSRIVWHLLYWFYHQIVTRSQFPCNTSPDICIYMYFYWTIGIFSKYYIFVFRMRLCQCGVIHDTAM